MAKRKSDFEGDCFVGFHRLVEKNGKLVTEFLPYPYIPMGMIYELARCLPDGANFKWTDTRPSDSNQGPFESL